MFDDLTSIVGKAVDPNVGSFFVQEDYVQRFITSAGVQLSLLNPGIILEFEKHVAPTAGLIRYILVDITRMYTVLLTLRYTLQFFGQINPFDGGFMEVIYTFTTPYTRFFLGYFPNIFGIDGGLFVSFYLLDRVDTILLKMVIIDPLGNRF